MLMKLIYNIYHNSADVPYSLKSCLVSFRVNSAETAKNLVNVINTLKITEYDGKNFETVVSLIRVFVSCLSNLVDASSKILLPETFPIISLTYLRPPELSNSTRYLCIIPSLQNSLNLIPRNLTNNASVIFYHSQKPKISVFIWSGNGPALTLK